MKSEIHPVYVNAVISCVCGSKVETRSTQPEVHIEICSSCHPFYTGKQKLMDTAGRVEKFRRKYAKADAKTATPETATPETATPA